MKISYNAPAMRASNALNASDSRVSKSLQRLSSGLKVTASKDNPSGYAIGRRMNTQITGLNTATQSSNNGISVIETADGALTEVHEMLQRMNELAVKGETGTLTTSDRMTLDEEVKQLKEEITRISTDTQFNGQTLLDGTFDLRGYTNNHKVGVDFYSDEVIPRKYVIDKLNVVYNKDGTIDMDATTVGIKTDGEYKFPAGVELTSVGEDRITLTDHQDFEITLTVEPDPIKDAKGNITGYNPVSPLEQPSVNVPTFTVAYSFQQIAGSNPPMFEAVPDLGNTDSNFKTALQNSTGSNIPADAKVSSIVASGTTDTLVITNDSGFRLELSVTRPPQTSNPATVTLPSAGGNTQTATEGLMLDVTGFGAMDTQTGANEGQQLAIRIPTISLSRLGIEKTRMRTVDECARANKSIKGAILYVSDVRSRLGAYQNRLEHTVNNLAVSTENMTASYSRIMDVDMAEEMTSYTTEQVISQAAVSMLAQANERPSQVLQLLQ